MEHSKFRENSGIKIRNKVNFEYRRFLYPGVIVLMVLTIIPSVFGVWVSLNRISQNANAPWTFVGLRNYLRVLIRAEMSNSLLVTGVYVCSSISITIVLGFLLALALQKPFFGRKIVMSLFILPVVFTPVVSGLIWKFMFMADLGVINYFLGLLGIPTINWLADKILAFVAVLIVDVWQWTPFCMYFLLAGLQNIPQTQYEAAYIDGASKAQTLFHIAMPQLLPISSVVLLFRLMDAFKLFDQIFVMTQGGPGRATQTLNLFAYYLGFRYFDYGLATALGIMIMFAIVFICRGIVSITNKV
jgi:multiple sugar transport system permease protein